MKVSRVGMGLVAASLAVGLAFAGSVQENASKLVQIGLQSLKPVTLVGSFGFVEEFSMGGVIFSNGVTTDSAAKRLAVYSVPSGAQNFKVSVGVPDSSETGSSAMGRVVLSLDGDLVEDLTPKLGDKPKDLTIDVRGKKALKIDFEGVVGLGEPKFLVDPKGPAPKPTTPTKQGSSKEPEKKPTTAAPSGTMPRVELIRPNTGSKFRQRLIVEWEGIEGAQAYGVELILIEAKGETLPTRCLRAFTVKGTTFEWNLSEDVADGDYQISVIAFGSKGVISKFSNPRLITVAKSRTE